MYEKRIPIQYFSENAEYAQRNKHRCDKITRVCKDFVFYIRNRYWNIKKKKNQINIFYTLIKSIPIVFSSYY